MAFFMVIPRFVAILSPDSSLYPANMATRFGTYLRQLVMAPMGFYIAPKKVVCIRKRSINIHQPRLPQVPIQIAKRWSLKKKNKHLGVK